MRAAAPSLLLLCLACGERDRITLRFDEDATRAEAVRAEVYALALQTRGGEPVDCDGLGDRSRSVDDGEVVVAQHTTLSVPLPADAQPLLVQVPQDRYLFWAEAFDRFGFRVAHGCTVDDVTSARRLELQIELRTDPRLDGELAAVGETSWLQHAGAPGLETARRLEVQALGRTGRLVDVEVRTLVESGQAVVLDPVLRTDDQGRAGSTLLVGAGPLEVLVHVRGLRGSPVRFALQGVPSPLYQVSARQTVAAPVTLVSGDVLVDSLGADDLVAVVQDSSSAMAVLFRGDPANTSLETSRRVDLGTAVGAFAVGRLDTDSRLDFVSTAPSATAGEAPELQLRHHHPDEGDSWWDPISEMIPADIVSVETLLVAPIDGNATDDVVLVATTATGRVLLLLVTATEPANSGQRVLSLRQRFPLPAFAADTTVSVGDLDSDGDAELILSSPIAGLWIVPCGDDVEGNGSGRYYVPVGVTNDDWPHLFAAIGFNLTAVHDVDEDGLGDLVLVTDTSAAGGGVGLRLARGTGRLTDLALGTRRSLAVDSANLILVADVNADGHADLLVSTLTPPRRALLMGGDGSGRFADPLLLRTDMGSVSMAVADYNVDGIADVGFLGTTTGTDHFVQLHLSTGLAQ